MCRPCSWEETPRPSRAKEAEARRLTVREQRAAAEIESNPPDPAIVAGLDRFVQARNARLARLERTTR